VRWTAVSAVVPVTIEMGQQRTWDHIPQRNCTWENTITIERANTFSLCGNALRLPGD